MIFNILILIVGITGGVYSMIEAYRDSESFMNHPRVRFYVSIFGRKGARVFCFILGMVVVLLGFYIILTGKW